MSAKFARELVAIGVLILLIWLLLGRLPYSITGGSTGHEMRLADLVMFVWGVSIIVIAVVGYFMSSENRSSAYGWFGWLFFASTAAATIILVAYSDEYPWTRNFALTSYIIWVVGLPLWFLGETVWHQGSSEARKHIQDGFKAVWAAVTVVLGALLLEEGKWLPSMVPQLSSMVPQ